ncbi:MAG: hypothetical protein C0418_05100 [Coriobacteriaceae bacterium]|nr:hypothetical protein [Coriobacteriaceae bacterium]
MNGRTAGAGLSGRRITHRETRRPIEIVLIRIVWFLTAVVDTLLGFRFALRLFGANAAASFTQFVYDITASLMAPFQAVFGTLRAEAAVFDWSILLAIAVYTVVGYGIAALIDAVTPRSTATTVETSEEAEGDVRPPVS